MRNYNKCQIKTPVQLIGNCIFLLAEQFFHYRLNGWFPHMLGRMLNLNDNTFQENWRWNSHLRWLICFLGLKPFRLLGEFSPLFLGNHLIEENHIIELLNMEILLQTWMSILLEERMLRKMKYLVIIEQVFAECDYKLD